MLLKKVRTIVLASLCVTAFTSMPVQASQMNLEQPNAVTEENTEPSEPLARLVQSPLRTSTFIVTGDDVRFRSAPGLSSTVLGILQKGEFLSVGTMNLDNKVKKDGYVWLNCQRQLTHQYGWVAVDYVKSTEEG